MNLDVLSAAAKQNPVAPPPERQLGGEVEGLSSRVAERERELRLVEAERAHSLRVAEIEAAREEAASQRLRAEEARVIREQIAQYRAVSARAVSRLISYAMAGVAVGAVLGWFANREAS